MSALSTDPLADMLTRIRNAIAVHKTELSVPHSKIKEAVATLLKENGYITSVSVENNGVGKKINIVLCDQDSNAKITEIERISKPGRRCYAGNDEIPVIKRGRGLIIISTSQGMMTGQDARKHKVGGELICKVY